MVNKISISDASSMEADATSLKNGSQPSSGEVAKGLAIFTASITLFAIYSMLIKLILLWFGLSVPEITYTVGLVVLPIFYSLSKYYKLDLFAIAPADQKFLLFRCISGSLSDVLMFVAFSYTSYSKAFCFFFTNTLFSPFLARWIIKEQIKVWDIIGILFGFSGMLLLVQPWNSEKLNPTKDAIGCFIGVLSAICASLAIIWTRKLSSTIHFVV